MNWYVGTSGYSYKEWKGPFYPEDLSPKDMLRFYSSRLKTVEINNTFYRMPKESVLEEWCAEVPEEFRFVLKAPQRITHFQRLKHTDDSLEYFLRVAGVLGTRRGPLLFQLPPQFHCDAARLGAFLDLVPSACRAAFEFRHESWFTDEVFGLLKKHNCALCVAEEDDELQVPKVATADWGYLRLRRVDYTERDLAEWAKWIAEQKWEEVYVFFKHEDEGKAPEFAQEFLKLTANERE